METDRAQRELSVIRMMAWHPVTFFAFIPTTPPQDETTRRQTHAVDREHSSLALVRRLVRGIKGKREE